MTPECDSCGQEMVLQQRLQNGKNKTGLQYRRRRYYCSLCDIYHTMYCDGQGDAEQVHEALEEAKKLNR